MTASQRRELVLHTALTEFAARGPHGTSARDIAHRDGISQPYLFRLFPTQEGVVPVGGPAVLPVDGAASSFRVRRQRPLAQMRLWAGGLRRWVIQQAKVGPRGRLLGPPWAGCESRDRGLRRFTACSATANGIYQRKGALAWLAM
jgi:hypothetical protein